VTLNHPTFNHVTVNHRHLITWTVNHVIKYRVIKCPYTIDTDTKSIEIRAPPLRYKWTPILQQQPTQTSPSVIKHLKQTFCSIVLLNFLLIVCPVQCTAFDRIYIHLSVSVWCPSVRPSVRPSGVRQYGQDCERTFRPNFTKFGTYLPLNIPNKFSDSLRNVRGHG